MPERILVTGVLGCLGAWTAHAALADGDDVVGYDLGEDTRAAAPRAGRRRRARDARPRRHHRPRGARAGARRARDHEGRPPRGAPGAVRAGEPAARDARQRRRHGQRLRGRRTPPRPHPGLAYASSTAVYNAADPSPAPERGGTSPATLYGVSKLADEGMARVYAAERGLALGRPAPVRRLRPRPRPGHDLRARPRRCSRPCAASRTRSASRAPPSTTTHPTSRARFSSRPTPGRRRGRLQRRRESPPRSRSSSRRSAPSCPGAELTWGGEPLPFPAELEAVGFDREVGHVPAHAARRRRRGDDRALPRRRADDGGAAGEPPPRLA